MGCFRGALDTSFQSTFLLLRSHCWESLRPICNFFGSVEWMWLAVFRFLARGTDSDDVDSVAFHLKAPGQSLQRRENAEILFFDVGDGLAMRADHMVVKVAVQLDSEGAVVHADFFQNASFDEEMNIFVNRRERDCGY